MQLVQRCVIPQAQPKGKICSAQAVGPLKSVACSPQANYTNRATAACQQS
jgi:hypothetical protein